MKAKMSLAVVTASLLGACSSSPSPIDDGTRFSWRNANAMCPSIADASSEDGPDEPSDAGVAEAGAAPFCNPVVEMHPEEGYNHKADCTATPYGTNPPSSGDHYAVWAAYQTYTAPVPPGFWVHNLEHGAVVITYNCPPGGAAEVAAAQALIDSLPPDTTCGFRRIIMTPDPDLDVAFAASAWGWTLRSNCFDATAFGLFIADHYGQGRETVCSNGGAPSDGRSWCP